MRWDFSVAFSHSEAFISALAVTFALTLTSILFGTLFGVIFGIAVLSRHGLVRRAARFYVEMFLALPVLVIMVWIYYVMPTIHPGFTLSGFTSAAIGLSLSLSAFVAEICRTGVGGIHLGEVEVAYCLGMNKIKTLRHIVVPQAARKMWPPLMGQYITSYKMSTVASVVAVNELLHTGGVIIAQTYKPIEIYTAIALIFIVTVVPLNMVTRNIYDSKNYRGIDRL